MFLFFSFLFFFFAGSCIVVACFSDLMICCIYIWSEQAGTNFRISVFYMSAHQLFMNVGTFFVRSSHIRCLFFWYHTIILHRYLDRPLTCPRTGFFFMWCGSSPGYFETANGRSIDCWFGALCTAIVMYNNYSMYLDFFLLFCVFLSLYFTLTGRCTLSMHSLIALLYYSPPLHI